MPRTGPIYTLPPGYLAVTGTTIQPSQHNPPLEDIAQALTESVPRNGSGPMTGNLPMGGFRLTGLGASTAADQAVRQDQVMLRSGSQAATADLPMGGFKITGLGAGTLAGDAVRRDQVVLRDGSQAMTGPLLVPVGTESAPGLQFGNANNGMFATLGVGVTFVANGFPIGILNNSGSLIDPLDIVTRASGDQRYPTVARTLTAGDGLTGGGTLAANRTFAVDATVVRTTGAQTIAGQKNFSNLSVWDANTGGQRFIKDGTQRVVVDFYTSTSTLAFSQRLTAGGDMEWVSAGSRQFIIRAPVTLGLGDGDIYLENNASDGDGTGLCVRASVNPTGNGMIFSVRSQAGALGLGVQQDKISSARAEMYLGSSDTGAGGNRVMHAGMALGEVGTFAMLRDTTVVGTRAPGTTVAGANLRYASSDGDGTVAPAGTWRLMGSTNDTNNAHRTSLWMRIS